MSELEPPVGSWPFYSDEERSAVDRVLVSAKVNYWTGNEGRQFEREFANYIGVKYAVAVANGTLALELCLRALGIGPGDEVIVTPRSFIASASVIVNVGATPVFADIDPVSQNLDPAAAEAAITARTKAIMLVHLAGWPCDLDPFQQIAERHGLHLLEDCAQAHGALYKGKKVGSFGSMSAFSFCQDKIISTAGEGGMVVTNDEALWRFAWSYKDHGKNPDKITSEPPTGSGFRWLHDSIGSNWRMTEIQSAVGRIQLHNLEANLARRQKIAGKYHAAFSGVQGLSCPRPETTGTRHAHYVDYLQVDMTALAEGWDRDRIIQEAGSQAQGIRAGACPEIYLEGAFSSMGNIGALPCANARSLGEHSIMLPCHHQMTDAQVDSIIQALSAVMSEACAKQRS